MRLRPIPISAQGRWFPQATPLSTRLFRSPYLRSYVYPPPASRRLFSHTSPLMTASKIDGNAIARSIRERLGAEVKQKQAINPRYRPSLKIVQVGDRSDSSMYPVYGGIGTAIDAGRYLCAHEAQGRRRGRCAPSRDSNHH
ncbi:hypothetical protein PMIN06_006019 [Paraphaeosphaeria minitans]